MSVFQTIHKSKWVLENATAFAIADSYPVTPGHSLVITKRVVADWFSATPEEQADVLSLVSKLKQHLDATLQPKPAGYNVGFNAGEAAGQTVMHLHVHVIPRYTGDVPDPRGGIRHVIPGKGNYLSRGPAADKVSNESDLKLSLGHPQSRLWDELTYRLIGAHQVDVLVSFVQKSGLDVIEQRLFYLLRNSSSIRILVSDYLSISDPTALKRLCDWQQLVAGESEFDGTLAVGLIEITKIPSKPHSFHPKAWRIIDGKQSFISVGSSNLSRPALETGIEWNLLSTVSHRVAAHDDFAREFESLWELATPITEQIVANYAARAKEYRKLHFEPECEDVRPVPEPRPWQHAALCELQKIRDADYTKALVAVATGMGKTWLAAFDVRQLGKQFKKRPRVLVVAHRSHILAQAESVLSCILDESFGEGRTSWYIGERGDMSGSLVVASIQKLARPEGLDRLKKEQFDYAIIDEVHHAHAPTYRRVLAQLSATFVLGLTATPERGDGIDVAGIFDDNLAYHATIGDGIEEDSLVPFHYIGIRDTVDFEQIPWRNGRFDLPELEQRVLRSERMQRLWKAMQAHPADRTIVFCCSKRHALFARDWLRSQGMTSAAVFSGDGSDGQIESLEALRTGNVQALCVVDMFNEGLDIPAVDRVIMLRPTESKVIFLQQLGRGLRAAEGKTRLLVIDFVGNHRIFANRMLHILSLNGRDAAWIDVRRWLKGEPPSLPEGCLLDVDLDSQDIIARFLPIGSRAAIETYRMLRDELGRRPLAAELLTNGILPRTLSQAAGSWFQFVELEGDLSSTEQAVVEQFKEWLRTIETTNLNKSYKMVVLRVLLDHGGLFKPVNIHEFSRICRRFMLQHSVLQRDLVAGPQSLNHRTASDDEWINWWREWPIDRWLDSQNGNRWFRLKGNVFQFAIDCPLELQSQLESMTEELVDWRLAAYSRSRRLAESEDSEISFEAKVSHANGRAILFLPDRTKLPGRPIGLVAAKLPDGTEWEFKFVKIACNVAKPLTGKANELSDLLKSWFGQSAGQPGTDFKVQFQSKDGKWSVRPLEVPLKAKSNVRVEPSKTTDESFILHDIPKLAEFNTHLPVYDLVAAAGAWGEPGAPEQVGWMKVNQHKLSKGMFVARVVGDSMTPKIPSGSWCLFVPCPAGSRQNRLLLVQSNTHLDPLDGGRYTVKRYRSTKSMHEDGWEHATITLEPLNPHYQPIEIHAEDAPDIRVIGEFVAVLEAN